SIAKCIPEHLREVARNPRNASDSRAGFGTLAETDFSFSHRGAIRTDLHAGYACLSRHINCIAAWRRPKIDPSGLASPFFLWHATVIVAAPCRRHEPCVIPSRLHPGAVPSAAVIQDKDQTVFIADARALHDVEVVVHEENLRRAGGILFVNSHERIDTALIVRLGKVPV